MVDRDFNIPTGPDRTGGVNLPPIDLSEVSTASSVAQPSAADSADAPAPTFTAFQSKAQSAPADSASAEVAPMKEEDLLPENGDDDYEAGGVSADEARSQGIDEVQMSFLALKDSIDQSRELKAREREREALEQQMEADREELADRENILANYLTLVTEQDDIIDRNTQERDAAKAELADVVAKTDETSEALARMKDYHNTQLQPIESALGRAKATADQAKNDERSRKSELNAAESELRRAEDENASTMAAAKHEQVAAAYDEARSRLNSAKDALEQAQRAYDDAMQQVEQAEGPLERSIEDLEARNAELKDHIAKLSDVISEARKRRQYCDNVYQYPDETAALRRSLTEDEETALKMDEEAEDLRNQLAQSKAKSGKAKLAIGIVVVVVVAIIIIVVMMTR